MAQSHMFVLYLSCYTWLAGATKRIATDELEVFGRVIHFLSLHICDNDVDVLAAIFVIVHASQEHEFGQHRKNHGHHGEFPVLHRSVVVDVRGPGPVDRDQSTSVDRPTEYVLWYEIALVPQNVLPLAGIRGVFLLADVAEPLSIRVIGLLEPLVDKTIGALVVECLAHELAHRQAGRGVQRIMALSAWHSELELSGEG